MRFIRLLGVLVIFYGLDYLTYGLRQLFGLVDYRADSYIVELNLSIGTITLIIGLGLVLAKEWARIAWLTAVTVLLTQHIFFLAVSYLSQSNVTLSAFNVVLIIILFLLSWSQLTRSTVSQHFR